VEVGGLILIFCIQKSVEFSTILILVNLFALFLLVIGKLLGFVGVSCWFCWCSSSTVRSEVVVFVMINENNSFIKKIKIKIK
jgi:hypothetical protein